MKNEFLTPALIAMLSLFFALVSVLVFFYPSTKAIRAKLRIGAALLTLSGLVACGNSNNQCYQSSAGNQTGGKSLQDRIEMMPSTCYEPIPVEDIDTASVKLDRKAIDKDLEGEIQSIPDTMNHKATCYMPVID